MSQPNTSEFEKYWNLLSYRKWRKVSNVRSDTSLRLPIGVATKKSVALSDSDTFFLTFFFLGRFVVLAFGDQIFQRDEDRMFMILQLAVFRNDVH